MNDDSNPGALSGDQPHRSGALTWRRAVLLALVGIACFHAAYTPAKSRLLAFSIVGYLICLVQLARLRTTPSNQVRTLPRVRS